MQGEKREYTQEQLFLGKAAMLSIFRKLDRIGGYTLPSGVIFHNVEREVFKRNIGTKRFNDALTSYIFKEYINHMP